MKTSLLKNFSFSMIALALSSTAFAAMDTDARVQELESKMTQVRGQTAIEGRYGAKRATARPEVDGEGWFITANILYWQARVGGTEFAYSDNGTYTTLPNLGAGGLVNLPISGRSKDMDFDWDWGLRIGLGYNLQHGKWDVRAEYTWFETNGSESSRAGHNSTLIPLRGASTIVQNPNVNDQFINFLFCKSAKSQYEFDYDAVDVELARAYFISSRLSFRPYLGVKAAWIDQEQTVRYTGGNPLLNAADNFTVLGLQGDTVHIKDTCDFWGVGPRVGFDTAWHIGNGFSIFGNMAGALLYGYFDVDHHERYSSVLSNKIDLHANRHAFSPTAQMQLGLRYDTYVYNHKQHIGIGLGFEVNYWWRQNQMMKIEQSEALTYGRYAEDISLHGLTLDFKWDF